MDEYHKMPAHHGLRDLFEKDLKGDKMEEKEKKCKTCKRDGIPSEETECGRCEKIRQLYQIRKELAEWHDERYMGDRLDRFEFDEEVYDRWPYLKEQHMDGMWYLDHSIKRGLDSILRDKMNEYQNSKDVPYYKRGTTKIWKNPTSRRKGEIVSRKSPLVSACCFELGTRMKGNDGWMYIVKLRKDNTHLWSMKK